MPSHRRKIFSREKRKRSSRRRDDEPSTRRKRRSGSNRPLKGAVLVFYKEMAQSLWNHIGDYVPDELGAPITTVGDPPDISMEDIKGIYGLHVKGGPEDGVSGYMSKCGETEHWSWYAQAMNDFFKSGKYKEFVRELG